MAAEAGGRPGPEPEDLWAEAGAWWTGRLLRCPGPRGVIRALSWAPLPEKAVLLTPRDLTGDLQVFGTRMPLLADQVFHYWGEAAALAAGPDPEALDAWSRTFQVVQAPLSPILDLETSSLVTAQRRFESGPEPPEGIWLGGRYRTGAQDAFLSAPLRARAWWRGEGLWIETATDWPQHVATEAARLLGLPPERVHVAHRPLNYTLDTRLWTPTQTAVWAAALSRACGHPVELTWSKEEEFIYGPKRPETWAHLETLLDPEGRLVALRGLVRLAAGAYGPLDQEQVDRCLLGLIGVYPWQSIRLEVEAVQTHTPPRGLFNGGAETLGQTLSELHLADLAAHQDEDPLSWRRRNLPAQATHLPTGGPLAEPAPWDRLLEMLNRKTDFGRKWSAFHVLGRQGGPSQDQTPTRRGIGLALGFQGSGFVSGVASPSWGRLRLDQNGRAWLALSLSAPDEPRARLWRRRAAQALKLVEAEVRLEPWVRGDDPDPGPAVLSRRFAIGGPLAAQLGEALARKAGVGEVSRRFKRRTRLKWDPKAFTGVPFIHHSWVACSAEVEAEPASGQVRVRRVTLVVDAGPIIDPEAARQALISSLAASLGWCFMEVLDYSSGRMNPQRYRTYQILRPDQWPHFSIHFVEDHETGEPRGLGHLPHAAVPGAVLSALRQALGASFTSLPLTRTALSRGLS